MWDFTRNDKGYKFVTQINIRGDAFSITILVCLFYNFNGKPQLDHRLGLFIVTISLLFV